MIHTCPFCDEKFEHRWTKRKFCSIKCYRNSCGIKHLELANKYLPFIEFRTTKPTSMRSKLLKISADLDASMFLNNSHKLKGTLIAYPDSPTGMVYVGVNKAPFMRNPSGHGFLGVLLQDENRVYVQNSETGKWYKKITAKIIGRTGITTAEYKIKYGLNQTTGLVSDATSNKLTISCLKSREGREHIGPPPGASKKGLRTLNKTQAHHRRSTVQMQNRHGTCELQLKTRMYEFLKTNKEFPGQSNRGETLYKSIKNRYGSFGEGLIHMGLPFFRRTGTNMVYTFPDGEVYRFNINRIHDRAELYSLIEKKCLTNFLPNQD